MNDADMGGAGSSGGRGGVPVTGLGIALVVTTLAAFILSWPYSWGMRLINVFPVDVAVTGLFGWLVARVIRAILRLRRVSSPGPALGIGLIDGALAVWFAWLAYFYFLFGRNFDVYLELMANPYGLLETIRFLAHNPRWSIAGITSPYFFYAAWIAEFLLIVGLVLYEVRRFLSDSHLCSQCGDWVLKTDDGAAFQYPTDEGLLQRLKGGEMSLLPDLPRVNAEEGAVRWLEVQGFSCPNCEHANSYVRVFVAELKRNDKTDELYAASEGLSGFCEIDPELEKKIFDYEPPAPPAELGEETPPPETGEEETASSEPDARE